MRVSARSLGSKNGDFITAVDEKSIIVVKEVGEQEDYSDMERIAHQILEHWSRPRENTPMWLTDDCEEIKEVSRSYKEARMALDVGKIFFSERKRYRLQLSGNRPSDLSAAHSAVQDVLSARSSTASHRMTLTRRR